MAKQSFLVVSLKGGKAKKLAQVLANETSLKILDYLANRDSTEAELSKILSIPISTVHYNLKILQDSKMIKSDEYHYSDKGRMVNHYTLANKYILIAPEHDVGLRERLRSILPVSIILLAAAGVIQIISMLDPFQSAFASSLRGEALNVGADASAKLMMASAPESAARIAQPFLVSPIAIWFLIGAVAALAAYGILKSFQELKG
jgi:DNA-binding transcriptional ArsR family regulator